MRLSELSRNRAEEYGEDLWQEFVIPPYYPQLELLQSSKPSVIEGGRGCGKTMLLRYLCHDTQFSEKRINIDVSALERIGIYWRMDTQFAKLMNGRGVDDMDWVCAFIHMGVLVISEEILKSLENASKHKDLLAIDLSSLDFSSLNSFDSTLPTNYMELREFIHSSFIEFQQWVSNIHSTRPLFYSISFVKELISVIKKQVLPLTVSTFHIYIDEYENLLESQKKIINTWLKHSQPPLIFNIAMKHNAFDVRGTLGPENLVDEHDFRLFDIETMLNPEFQLFAAEIFLLKLKRIGYQNSIVDDYVLFDTSAESLSKRQDRNYQKKIRDVVSFLLPKCTSKDVSRQILNDDTFSRNIKAEIKKQIDARGSSIPLQDLYDNEYPEAVVIIPSLLNRKNSDIDFIHNEFLKYKSGNSSKFDDWVPNNIVGCTLYWYGKYNRICPIYAGESAFMTMAKGNIRHFLELCYSSLAQNPIDMEIMPVSPDSQALAVKNVSSKMLKEIKALGNIGNVLYDFTIRLGSVFENARKNIAQSEPEQNHFSISDSPSREVTSLLNELVKWSVLYEYKLTKRKGLETGSEYLLNPIYSSYFTISYRKKRRITLRNADIVTIAYGDVKDFERYLKNRSKQQDEDEVFYSLF
jgi:hypothetical protein